jgi:hypothetical protein
VTLSPDSFVDCCTVYVFPSVADKVFPAFPAGYCKLEDETLLSNTLSALSSSSDSNVVFSCAISESYKNTKHSSTQFLHQSTSPRVSSIGARAACQT